MTSNVIGNTTLGSLLFDKTADDNYTKSYWLASPGILADSERAVFGPGIVYNTWVRSGFSFHSNKGSWMSYGFGVRPVISLKSDTTIAEIKKLYNQNVTEDDWEKYTVPTERTGSASNGEAGNHGN